jgi:hypothetical protein
VVCQGEVHERPAARPRQRQLARHQHAQHFRKPKMRAQEGPEVEGTLLTGERGDEYVGVTLVVCELDA